MNNKARIRARELLSGNTIRLFLISLTSLFLRYGTLVIVLFTCFSALRGDLFLQLSRTYGTYPVYTAFLIFAATAILLSLLFVSAVRMGESVAYFTRANGGTGTFSSLFRFLRPSQSLRAFITYALMYALKLLWRIYFFIPVCICFGCAYYLYSLNHISQALYIILSAGAAIILAFAFVMCRISAIRLRATPYYMCLQRTLSPLQAIKKSIRFTDGYLSEGAVLEYSLLGWIFSCIFIIPAFYVIPYTKLLRAVFATDVVFSRHSTKAPYAINVLKLADTM